MGSPVCVSIDSIYANPKKDQQRRSTKKFHAPTWRKGAWNFSVERFLLNTRFPAASYETAEENRRLNKESFDRKLPGDPFARWVAWKPFVERCLFGSSIVSVCRLFLGSCKFPQLMVRIYTHHTNRHADAKKSQHRSTKTFQALCLAKGTS
jgi:hypothetical protein